MEKNLVYDLILLEGDRVAAKRQKKLDLYHKDHFGNMVPIADAYDSDVEDLITNIFKKRKMRYLISFVDALEVQDGLLPSTHKVLRYLAKHMSYGNTFKCGVREIQEETGCNMKYVLNGVKQLCEKDVIRFRIDKGRRTYIVNPIYFYKGSLRSIFKATRYYDSFPKRNEKLEVEFENDDD